MEELIMKFIGEQFLILIPVLLVIGKLLKTSPKISDWVIPWVLLVISVLLCFAHVGVTVDAFIQAVLVAGAAVFVHQLVKQSTEG